MSKAPAKRSLAAAVPAPAQELFKKVGAFCLKYLKKYSKMLWAWWQEKHIDVRIFWYFVLAYISILELAFFYITGSLGWKLSLINFSLAYVIAKVSAYSIKKMLG